MRLEFKKGNWVPVCMETVDYRHSHLQKGMTYDATLAASPFDAYMAKWETRYLLALVKRLYPHGIPRYLDFACGTGRITQTVGSLAKQSFGVDISASMLEVARERCPETHFVCTDVTQEDAETGLFDLITAFRFFGNAQNELRMAVLLRLNRLVRANGYLIINSHRNPYSFCTLLHNLGGGGDEDMDLHYWKLKRLLREAGFKIVYQRAIGFWLFRAKLMQQHILNKAPDQFLESTLGFRCFVPFAPDAIMLAQKIKAL